MSKKLLTGISAKAILLWLLALSFLDTVWSNPMPAAEWDKCSISTMHKKKSLPGKCYTYQQCQWRGIGDYDMEVVSCPQGKIFDENISECVSEKVLAFNFDKSRCEEKKGSQPQSSGIAPEPANPTPTTQKGAEVPLVPAPTVGAPSNSSKGSKRQKKPPMSMADMAAFSEQSMAAIGAAKDKINQPAADSPTITPSEVQQGDNPPTGAQGQEVGPSPMGRSMQMVPIPPIQPMDSNVPSRNQGVGNIKQPDFFKPFDNFPTTRHPFHTRQLTHEALVRPRGRVG